MPERSPRTAAPGEAFARLEDAGAEIVRLQVSYCARNRMPLQKTMLDGLNTVQRTLTRAVGDGC